MSQASNRLADISAALGEPRLPPWPRGGEMPPIEACTLAIVETLLGRLARVSAALGDRERAGEIDRLAERLLLCDLALTAGALRALDAAAADRLTQASTELEQARAAIERADLFRLEPEAT